MSFQLPSRQVPLATELAKIDDQLAFYARRIRDSKDPAQIRDLRSACDGILERRYRTHPVEHRCLSEENWSILKVLEEGG